MVHDFLRWGFGKRPDCQLQNIYFKKATTKTILILGGAGYKGLYGIGGGGYKGDMVLGDIWGWSRSWSVEHSPKIYQSAQCTQYALVHNVDPPAALVKLAST